MILFAHYRNMNILEAVDNSHDAVVDKNFGLRHKFINQRDEFNALADLRNLTVNGFAVTKCEVNFAENFFQGGITVAESSIIGVAGM